MSRSIHTTRRSIKEEEHLIYSDSTADRHTEKLEQLRKDLAKKRRIKKQVKKERLNAEQPSQSISLESIPICVLDEGEFIHYPATPTDILKLMHLLPMGVLDGISSIELCLGKDYQDKYYQDGDLRDTDPFLGRPGYEILPGIFAGNYLGVYEPDQARIRLFAYVYDPALPNREMWELYLQLMMLSTLVHEIGHHDDWMRRIARGRWLADNKQKNEIYAEKIEYEWVRQYVIPYLQQAYPESLKALEAWTEHYGGVSIPLSVLADDPRVTTKQKDVFKWHAFLNVSSAFENLARNVAEGESLVDTRLQFARELHYAEIYAEALEIIQRVLAEYPEHLEALTLKADIYEHQEKYDEAQTVLDWVISRNETYVDAWYILTLVHRGRRDWENVVIAATRAVELHPVGFGWVRCLEQCAYARLELGDFEGVEADIKQLLERGKQVGARKASELQKEMRSRRELSES